MRKSMKLGMLKYSLVIGFLVLGNALLGASEERDKKISKSFTVTSETTLVIENSFGEIQMDTWDKDEFKVDIEIRVEGKNSDRAEKLLNAIEIDISETSGEVSIRTDIEQKLNTKGDESFEINYTVMAPAKNRIEIENQFGDTYIGERIGDAEIEIKFGNLKTEDFQGLLDLTLSFGKASIGNTTKSDIEIKYGDLRMGNGFSMDIEQQFSNLEIGDFQKIVMESKYGGVELGTIGTLDAEVQFSKFQVEQINQQLEMEGSYVSNFEVRKLSKDFESFRFYGKFSSLELNVEEGTSANIQADMSFCKLKDYSEQIDFYYQSKDDTRKEYKGRLGAGDDQKKIVIKSSYGDVRIE
ncbi:MAG: hypothetical protein JXR10_01665 [Cyclobacteriaceae bacterium]